MKTSGLLFFVTFLFLGVTHLNAQDWVEKMQDRSSNVNDVILQFNSDWGSRPYQRGYGWKQFKRWQDFWEPRVHPHGVRPPHDHAWREHLRFKRTFPSAQGVSRSSNWTSMGPDNWTSTSYNPGIGRVNVIAEDPNDPNTIYIGAPAGGCWKSTNAGVSWTVLTDDFQSLGVSAIAIDYTNSNVIYIGTGDDDGALSSSSNPSGVKGICPDGWHVPSHSEWNQMEMELGMPEADTSNTGWRGTHGIKMKSKTGWNNSGSGNNISGMNVFPAGGFFASNLFGAGGNASFWSSTEFSPASSWGRALKHQYSGVGSYYYYFKTYGFSCRCVMD